MAEGGGLAVSELGHQTRSTPTNYANRSEQAALRPPYEGAPVRNQPTYASRGDVSRSRAPTQEEIMHGVLLALQDRRLLLLQGNTITDALFITHLLRCHERNRE